VIACERKVVQDVTPCVLLRDNVLDLVGRPAVPLLQKAILAAIPGALAD